MALLFAGLTVSAQGWEKIEHKADELTGTKAGCTYRYQFGEMGSFTVWDWSDPQFCINAKDRQFATQIVDKYVGMKVLVGLYDEKGNLQEKFDMWLDKNKEYPNNVIGTRNAGVMSNPVGQNKKVKKIFKVLQSGSGYVRIVARRYNDSDFDIKITPYTE